MAFFGGYFHFATLRLCDLVIYTGQLHFHSSRSQRQSNDKKGDKVIYHLFFRIAQLVDLFRRLKGE